MKIQHNSATKIESVKSDLSSCNWALGTLCFAPEGVEYNLAGEVNYVYTLELDEDKDVIDVDQFWYQHDHTECTEALEDIREELYFRADSAEDLDLEIVSEIMDGSDDLTDYCDLDDADAGWLVQQLQGKLAKLLGYKAAFDTDEQGPVYYVYCVGIELKEFKI